MPDARSFRPDPVPTPHGAPRPGRPGVGPARAAAVLVVATICGVVAAEPHRHSHAEGADGKPAHAHAFEPFHRHVHTRWDDHHLFVESDGIPDHTMMVGIRAWQQQVPLPQDYTGENAWRIPLRPKPAESPLSTKDGFFRGAIAIAVNGVPIFNPIKNDGRTDTFLAGELDDFGGHAGRADDYHYHIAPVHLNGGDPGRPVAFALDGYPIYGYTEPDGSPVRPLDAWNGHEDATLGYHYHATKTYPYLNGGFRGEVTQRDGQVDPQPHAHPVREATSPLPGAVITGFRREPDGRTSVLTFELRGKTGTVRYTVEEDGTCRFVFTNPDGTTREQTYRTADATRGGDRAGEQRERRPEKGDKPGGRAPESPPGPGPATGAERRPWIESHFAELDADADGALSLAEMKSEASRTTDGYDADRNGSITVAERDAGSVRTALGGFVKQHWAELDRNGDGAVARGELLGTALDLFAKADRDGDGRVAGPEVAAAPAPPAKPPADDPDAPRSPGKSRDDTTPPRKGGGGGGKDGTGPGPVASLSRVLGAPTDRSIVLSVHGTDEIEFYAEYGTRSGVWTGKTPVGRVPPLLPCDVVIDGLAPDTEYVYRLRTRRPGAIEFDASPEDSFRTQRRPGSTFSFTVQGDSHPERLGKMFDPDLYVRTLTAVARSGTDFHLTLGDDFSIERLIERGPLSQEAVDAVYARQRGYLGIVGATAPLFLVNGNHEQAARYLLDGTPRSPAVLAGRARIAHFPLPEPGDFYTGNREPVQHVGLPRDYYAWTWGDALFVVIDPYWHSAVAVDNTAGAERVRGGKGERDLWQVGLGDTQYRWLRRTLEESRAIHKFVFAHHVNGTGRGGVEQAPYYEWGGKDRRGADLFDEKRPGWGLPIHALFVKTGVTIFFQGHDHVFARQELDGVVYQSVPNPADATYTAFNREAYTTGDVLPCSGHVRVTVSPAQVRVEYVRSVNPGDERRAGAKDGDVAFSYAVPARARTPR